MEDNKKLSRFELTVEGHIAYANYHFEEKILFIDYVFAPEELRGTGAAGKLMEEICQFSAQENLKIKPICGYAAVWLKKHKEYHGLLS
jgi:predicted GNAT family acetyltransferase